MKRQLLSMALVCTMLLALLAVAIPLSATENTEDHNLEGAGVTTLAESDENLHTAFENAMVPFVDYMTNTFSSSYDVENPNESIIWQYVMKHHLDEFREFIRVDDDYIEYIDEKYYVPVDVFEAYVAVNFVVTDELIERLHICEAYVPDGDEYVYFYQYYGGSGGPRDVVFYHGYKQLTDNTYALYAYTVDMMEPIPDEDMTDLHEGVDYVTIDEPEIGTYNYYITGDYVMTVEYDGKNALCMTFDPADTPVLREEGVIVPEASEGDDTTPEDEEFPFTLEFTSDITVSEVKTTERVTNAGDIYLAYEWVFYGECDVFINWPDEGYDWQDPWNCSPVEIYERLSYRYGYEFEFIDTQETEPWEPGNTYDAQIKIYSMENLNVCKVIDVRVTVEALDIESISAEDYSWTPYTPKSPVIIATHKDGSTSTVDIYDYKINYVDEWPTTPGTYELKMRALDGKYNFTIKLTVLDIVSSGKCGDTMNWNYDKESGTLTISGTGAMYNYSPDANEPAWWHYPIKHIVVEEGVESLCEYGFDVGYSVDGEYITAGLESIQLPKSLTKLPSKRFFDSKCMETLVIPEGISSLTEWSFTARGLKELYLPKNLSQIDLIALLWATVQTTDDYTLNRESTSLVKIHFAGTEDEWRAIQHVKSEDFSFWGFDEFFNLYDDTTGDYIGNDAFYAAVEDIFAQVEVVFEPVPEDIVVENGTATVPDSAVDIVEGEDVVIDVTAPSVDNGGEGSEGGEVPEAPKVESVVIGSTTVDKIVDANTNVEIKLPDATVSFDKDAIGSIGEQAGNKDVTIVAKEVEKDDLTDEQKAVLEEKEVHVVLNLEAYAGENKLTQFGGGKVTISVPFELPEGKDGSEFLVAYIADDGTMTVMPTSYANGALTFETTHFSSYVVLEVENSSAPDTGDSTAIALFVMLMAVCGIGLTACVAKRKTF